MSVEQPASVHPAVRAVIGLTVAVAAGFGGLVAWFVGMVTYTGCFISCGEPNPLAGMGFIALTAALVGVMVVAVAYIFLGWSRERMLRLWLIGTGVGAILGIASLVAS